MTDANKILTILALDIDIFYKAVCNQPNMAEGMLKELKKRKDKLMVDEDIVTIRYDAICTICDMGGFDEKNSV